MQQELPTTLAEAMAHFADEQAAFEFVRDMRWSNGCVECVWCGGDALSFVSTRKVWKCKGCKRSFSVKVGTVFEDSPIKLGKWLCCFWLIVNAKNGISSYEIHRALGVTQKTAWFMLHRARLAIQTGSIVRSLRGTVEVDESWIGGQARFMHADVKRKKGITSGTMNGRTPVMGLLERGKGKRASRVVAEVVMHVGAGELMPRVRKYVLKGSRLESDSHHAYRSAAEDYEHKVVDHAEAYVQDGVHTNGLENFWSLLKRTIRGTYVSVEPFHLFRYLSEQVFRFNERKHEDGDQGRFVLALAGIVGKRLTYKKLIGDDEHGLPA